MNHWSLGFDIGGTKIYGALFHWDKSIPTCVHEITLPTEREKGYPHFLSKMAEIITTLCDQGNILPHDLRKIALALPGSIDPESKIMLSGNTPMLVGKNIHEDLKSHLDFSPSLAFDCENDGNCFALAEVHHGVGLKFERETGIPPEKQHALGIVLGTGVGGGIILHGKIYNGHRGGAMEVGHTVIVPGGVPCYCGRNGCAEQYLSGLALERAYFELSGSKKRALEILTSRNDPYALQVKKDYFHYFLNFVANLVNFFDPHYIVLGGSLSKHKEFYSFFDKNLGDHCFLPNTQIPIYPFHLNHTAGALGSLLRKI